MRTILLFLCILTVNLHAQSWVPYDTLPGFITDIEIHNGQRYTTFKTGEVLQGDDTIKYYPVQNFQETGLLSICWWKDSLCVMVSGLDSIQRVICGTDTLLSVSYKSPWSIRHRAGDMVGVDSVLYVAFGDGSYPAKAQDTSDFRGKIIAIEDDTTYLFAYGLRNPWKIDTAFGFLYVADVGDHTEEEVDFISLDSIGKNFGWPCVEGTHVFDTTCGVTYPPLYTYLRAHTGNGIIGGKFFQQRYWWCDNFYQFGGRVYKNGAHDSIPCPQYPDGMYVNGDTIFVYDYTGKIFRWDEGGPLSLDSIPVKPKPEYPPDLLITNDEIKWHKRFENSTFMVLTIDNRVVTKKDASFRDSIDLSDYVPGIYVLVLMTPYGVAWSKLFLVIR